MGYDSYLTGFESTIPQLLARYNALGAGDPLKAKLAEQIALLRAWDLRWSESSIPTSLAVYWGEVPRRMSADAREASPQQQLEALAAASDKLTADFGTWKTPWGEINRFQRLTDDIVHPFSDAGMLAKEMPNARLLQANSLVELRMRPERLTEEIADFLDEVWAPRARKRAKGEPKRAASPARRAPASRGRA